MFFPEELESDLRRMNPWWSGRPMPALPATRRRLVEQIHLRLRLELAPAVVVRGPRQVGKTTSQLQVIQDLLDGGVDAHRIFRVQCDDLPLLGRLAEPILRLADWYEAHVLRRTLNEAARASSPSYLFLDEVQNVEEWAPQLKALVDSASLHVVVTGSSALRIERGRDSLAGRITTLEVGTLSLVEIARFHGASVGEPFLQDNGVEPLGELEFWAALRAHGEERQQERQQAFRWFSERGGYPLAHRLAEAPWPLLADQLNETVIRRFLHHDLGDLRIEDRALLEEVFRLACRYAGQAPAPGVFVREARRALGEEVTPAQMAHAFDILADSLLLRLIPPLEMRLKRTRGHKKICLADHSLRASWLQEPIPLDPAALDQTLAPLAGHLAESVLGAAFSTISGLDLNHVPESPEQPEIDFVMSVGARRIPIEVKYQRRIDPLRDTEGLRTFLEKAVNHAPFGILVTLDDDNPVLDPRIVSLPLSSVMLLR